MLYEAFSVIEYATKSLYNSYILKSIDIPCLRGFPICFDTYTKKSCRVNGKRNPPPSLLTFTAESSSATAPLLVHRIRTARFVNCPSVKQRAAHSANCPSVKKTSGRLFICRKKIFFDFAIVLLTACYYSCSLRRFPAKYKSKYAKPDIIETITKILNGAESPVFGVPVPLPCVATSLYTIA